METRILTPMYVWQYLDPSHSRDTRIDRPRAAEPSRLKFLGRDRLGFRRAAALIALCGAEAERTGIKLLKRSVRFQYFLVMQTDCRHFHSFLGPHISSCGAEPERTGAEENAPAGGAGSLTNQRTGAEESPEELRTRGASRNQPLGINLEELTSRN